MVHLLLVRHGETSWNAANRYQGQTDIGLSERGIRQAHALARRLSRQPLAAIYASDLRRAAETARIIATAHELSASGAAPVLRFDPRLRELDFGAWEGLTYEEIERLAPAHLARWNANRLEVAPPDGETLAALSLRVGALLGEIARDHRGEKVLVVAHGGPLRALMCLALGLPATSYWQFRFENATLSSLELHDRGTIINFLNDRAHLEGLPDGTCDAHCSAKGARLLLVLGGARSGKSAYALERAQVGGSARGLYVATAEAQDDEMRQRIEHHRRERGPGWETLEAPRDVAQAIRARLEAREGPPYRTVLVDCVTLLVSNLVCAAEDPFSAEVESQVLAEVEELADCARQSNCDSFIVTSNEVGMGLVPPYPLGRAYRDLLGRANQRLAALADEVVWLISGIPLWLK